MNGRGWVDAVLAAGATAASFVPSDTLAPTATAADAAAQSIEESPLDIHPVPASSWRPAGAAFLEGLQQWLFVAYDGIVPIVRGWLAAAVRRRVERRPHTAHEIGREVAITFVDRLSPGVRASLEASGVAVK